jgi:hypothetical protein
MKYVCDRNPGVSLEIINLTFPCEKLDIIKRTEEVIQRWNEVPKPHHSGQAKPAGKGPHERVRMVVADQIASNPGYVPAKEQINESEFESVTKLTKFGRVCYPWEDIVALCRKYGVISLVDAAHAIGQVKTDVKRSDPDFWVSVSDVENQKVFCADGSQNCHKWLMR